MKNFTNTAAKALFISSLIFIISSCSESTNTTTDTATADTAAQQEMMAEQATMPSGRPTIPATQKLSTTQQAALDAAKGLSKQGKVIEMMHAAGYTYMNVDVGGDKSVWIAASMMRVRPQQIIKWGDAAVMRNFTSKSLHRTFDEIQFVSNAVVVQ